MLNIFVYYMYVTVLHYGKIKIDWLIESSMQPARETSWYPNLL